jgi:hypothetical protein
MAGTSKPLSKWIFEMKKKYREYTHAAEENMPYLTKFYALADEAIEPNQKESEAAGPSKRRAMWRKLARKASMGRDTNKETRFAHAVGEVHRRKHPRNDHDLIAATPIVDPNFDRSTSFANGEADFDDHVEARLPKEGIEQGVLCLNMTVARLYYDFNRSYRRLASVERFFQRLLMKIRKPSYIKSISIKELDLGRHPPFARAMRILPPDTGGALAMEIDLEWHGGGHLTCETRLDLREQATQGEVAAQLAESGSEGDVTAAVLSGLRGEFDDSGSFSAAVQEGRQAAEHSNKKGRWMQSVKSMISRVADQISQVPIVLKIRLVSLKGTVVLKLKAPPSDRVWFEFKTMPDIHFEPEPCIGEHRISSDALARVISNAIKVQIRDSVVMPFCEDIFLNWMMADKENWLPTSTFPFPFFDSQASEASKQSNELHSSSSDESSRSGHGHNKPPKAQVKSQKQAQEQQASSDAIRPRRTYSDLLSGLKPVRSASADQLNAQASVPKPPRSSSRVRLSTLESAPVRALSPMLSSDHVMLADEPARQLDMVRSAMDSSSKDYMLQSEGSVSDSDVQFLANQVANPGDVKEVADDPKLMKRRARVKKMLGEVRHLKHHKRQDDGSA